MIYYSMMVVKDVLHFLHFGPILALYIYSILKNVFVNVREISLCNNTIYNNQLTQQLFGLENLFGQVILFYSIHQSSEILR